MNEKTVFEQCSEALNDFIRRVCYEVVSGFGLISVLDWLESKLEKIKYFR